MKPHNKAGRAEKERHRKTTKLKRRNAPGLRVFTALRMKS